MRNLFILIFTPLLMVVGMNSCKSEKEERVLKGDEYFPINKGEIKMYQIDTFFYNSFTGETDTVSHNYREEIKDKLIDASGDTFYSVELSLYNTNKNKWEGTKSFSRKVSGNYAIENIDNKPEIKMLFPLSTYKIKGSAYVWNLNMFNNEDITNVKYVSLFKSFNNKLATFDDCVSVELQSPEANIINNIRTEVYAKDKGLIYRHIDKSDYLDVSGNRNGIEIFVRLKP